jgi:hypothetical protein
MRRRDLPVALIRCTVCGAPAGRTQTYGAQPFEPEGHPKSGLICGTLSCVNPGVAYLTLEEARAYAAGRRIFAFPTQAAKVKLADPKP